MNRAVLGWLCVFVGCDSSDPVKPAQDAADTRSDSVGGDSVEPDSVLTQDGAEPEVAVDSAEPDSVLTQDSTQDTSPPDVEVDADHDGQSVDHGDCDDTNPAVYYHAPVVACDGVINDCDTAVQEVGGILVNGVATSASLADVLASAAAGDVVELCEGVHVAAGATIDKALTLRGKYGATVTFVQTAGTKGSVLTVATTSPVTLEGLTVRFGDAYAGSGGGVAVGQGADVALADMIVTRNKALGGGGIFVGADSKVRLTGVTITRNEVGPDSLGPAAGGLWVDARAQVVADGTTISENRSAGNCGGVVLGESASFTADPATTVTANHAVYGKGGGLCAKHESVWSGGSVTGNDSGWGGGIATVGVSTLSDVIISDNKAGAGGGGLLMEAWFAPFAILSVTLEDVRLVGNSAATGGNAAFMPGSSTGVLVMNGGAILSGTATSGAGGGAGVQLLENTRIEATDVDWGTGATDNAGGEDVWLSTAGVACSYGGGATFGVTDSASATCP